jgi:hypothetical protein
MNNAMVRPPELCSTRRSTCGLDSDTTSTNVRYSA